MELASIKCEDCGEIRVGYVKKNEPIAERDDCPECGSREWKLHPNLQYLIAGT